MNHHSIKIMTRAWRESFCVGYFQKYKKWPEINQCNLRQSSYLHKCLMTGTPVDKRHRFYYVHDWDEVKFLKTFGIPSYFNFTDLIADKATSLELTELMTACQQDGTIGKERSVIIQWLKKKDLSPEESLNLIS